MRPGLCTLALQSALSHVLRTSFPPGLLQPHMSFENADHEAHKDAAYVVQLGINSNLGSEHAPKVRHPATGP